MALLTALNRCKDALGIGLHVAHLNHLLRDSAADDAQLAATAAASFGIPFTVESADVAAVSAQEGLSIEEAARDLRYSFFAKIAADAGANKIATGHNADDQTETFIMRMLRGAGLDGLTGIPYARPLAPGSDALVVRPLLDTTREQVLAYCSDYSVPYLVDESNFSTAFTRNKVRHSVVPALDDISPGWRSRILRTMDLLRDDQDFLVRAAQEQESALRISDDDRGVSVQGLDSLLAMHPALASRVLRRLSLRAGAALKIDGRLSSERVLGLLERLRLGGNFTFQLGGGLQAVREYDTLTFLAPGLQERSRQQPVYGVITFPGQLDIPELSTTLVAEVLPVDSVGLSEAGPYSALLDIEKIPTDSVTVRAATEGDRFVPLGMEGSKKLQDFFVDMKVPQSERRQAIVLESDGTIIWLVGYRISALARITESTVRIVRLSLRPWQE